MIWMEAKGWLVVGLDGKALKVYSLYLHWCSSKIPNGYQFWSIGSFNII
jgi:hypothetical protein